jgi:hypothetical protein
MRIEPADEQATNRLSAFASDHLADVQPGDVADLQHADPAAGRLVSPIRVSLDRSGYHAGPWTEADTICGHFVALAGTD